MPDFAKRLVNELMLVSVLVAGEGATMVADALTQAGAVAEVWDASQLPGYDLVILLAEPEAFADPASRALVQGAGAASDRLLFVPLRAGGEGGPLPELAGWFELFVEHGFQPVVDFDAGFAAAGAFLMDRAVVAGEAELAAFADRLQLGGAVVEARRAAVAQAAEDEQSALVALREQLQSREVALAQALAELASAREAVSAAAADKEARIMAEEALSASRARQAYLEADHEGWETLRGWVRQNVGDAARNALERLVQDWPLLIKLRNGQGPALTAPVLPRRRYWARLAGSKPAALHPVIADAVLVRASHLFDAAWYVASQPELAQFSALDPVFHYIVVGSARGADPGPWFDSAAYVAAHPESAGCPLAHALRHGQS